MKVGCICEHVGWELYINGFLHWVLELVSFWWWHYSGSTTEQITITTSLDQKHFYLLTASEGTSSLNCYNNCFNFIIGHSKSFKTVHVLSFSIKNVATAVSKQVFHYWTHRDTTITLSKHVFVLSCLWKYTSSVCIYKSKSNIITLLHFWRCNLHRWSSG